jgi:PAS domain S-box-containing protein
MPDEISRRLRELEAETSALRAATAIPYRAIVEDMTEMVVRWAPDGTRLFVNDAYCRVFGVRREDAIGTSFWPLISPEDRERVERRIARLSRTAPVSTDRHRSIGPSGTDVWTEWTDRALYGPDGVLVELQSVGRDITERVAIDEKLRGLERAEAASRAAAMVAHDLVNVFQTLTIHSDLLATANAQASFQTLQLAIDDGVRVLGRLRALRLGRPVTHVRVDLNRRIEDALDTLQAAVGPNVRMETQLSREPATIVGDGTQLDQILLNLVRNSSDAMGATGTVVLATDAALPRVALDARHRFAGRQPETCRVLRVIDAGGGVPPEILPRMFQPRVSSKPDAEGLGLATVKSIVDSHFGSIVVETSSAGTTFELAFPAATL